MSVLSELSEKGWARVPSVFDGKLIDKVLEEYYRYEPEFQRIQDRKGLSQATRNATHHTFVLCRTMLRLLEENALTPLLFEYFEGSYILNTMGLSKIPPQGEVYTQRVHRDTRSFTGSAKLWLNTLIMLDDSTKDNGATWIWEGSQAMPDKPSDEEFFRHATQVTGKRGDVLLFDGNIWHSAGKNYTDQTRHIITPIYSKPFIKQQLDYPRAFGPDFGLTLSPHLRQVLGYRSRVPASLEEFYQPEEDRFYQRDQG